MFSRSYRLSREELSKVIKAGRTLHSSFFTLKIIDLGEKNFKTAFVISKKELRFSVMRNRAKRRARMALRELLPNIPPFQMVIFPKRTILSGDFKDIVEEFRKALK